MGLTPGQYHSDDVGDAYSKRQASLAAERAVALSKGEEVALPCPWQAPWNPGAPLPHVIADGYRTLLLYLVDQVHPHWDGTYVNVVDPSSSTVQPIALVEFTSCESFRFGTPNDEVLSGHPLYGKGLEFYAAHLIANSHWLAELQRINSVHSQYDPARWLSYKHYLLVFHDETFECIAADHRVEILRSSFAEALALATQRLLRRPQPSANLIPDN